MNTQRLKQNPFIVVFVMLVFAAMGGVNAAQKSFPSTGTIKGVIERTESDREGLYSIWFKVNGRMHEFVVRGAKFINGSSSDLQKGKYVQVMFKNRGHSEMDDFFTADATEITVLKEGDASAPK